MRRKGLALAAVAVVALTLSACAGTAATDPTQTPSGTGVIDVEPRTIGLILSSRASPVTVKTEEAIILAAEQLGWEVRVVDSNNEPDKAAKAMLAFVAEGVDGVMALSVEASTMRRGLLDARDAGIPSCQAGTVADSDLYDAIYRDDNVALGEELMDYIAESTPDARVGVLHATVIQAGIDRQTGVEQSLENHPDVVVVADSTPDLADPTSSTQKLVTDMITVDPTLTSIYAVFDNFTQGAIAALRNARSQAQVFTYYGTPANVEALRTQDEFGGFLDSDLATTGILCLDQMLRFFEDGTPVDPEALAKRGGLSHRMVTKENVEEATAGGPATYPNEELIVPFVEEWTSLYGAN